MEKYPSYSIVTVTCISRSKSSIQKSASLAKSTVPPPAWVKQFFNKQIISNRTVMITLMSHHGRGSSRRHPTNPRWEGPSTGPTIRRHPTNPWWEGPTPMLSWEGLKCAQQDHLWGVLTHWEGLKACFWSDWVLLPMSNWHSFAQTQRLMVAPSLAP